MILYTLQNKFLYNSITKKQITSSSILELDKKYFGLKKPKQLKKIDKYDVKGLPFLYIFNNKKVLIKVIPRISNDYHDNSLIELSYISLFNEELLLSNATPSIPFLYDFYIDLPNEYPCLSNIPFHKLNKIEHVQDLTNILLCEYIEQKDLDNWCIQNQNILEEYHWKSIIFQVVYTLSILQDKYKFIHNDLHPGNILIDTILIDSDLIYNYFGTTFKVPNTGYIAKLWDFEISNIYNEDYDIYSNPIVYEVGYNKAYDLHTFLKGILVISFIPDNLVSFINSLYPYELLYYTDNNVNLSDNTKYIKDGLLTVDALNDFPNLPTPHELLSHDYFLEYLVDHDTVNNKAYPNKFSYPEN